MVRQTEADPTAVRAEPTPERGSKGGYGQQAPEAPPAPPYEPPPAQSSAPPPPEGPRRGSGAKAGLVLIVIGTVFLLAQLVPGVTWWSFWPLIIVVAGIIQAVTPGSEGWSVNRLFDGLVTVSFGLVALGITTGVVGFDVVWEIMSLWPVLIIAIGLDLLGKAMHTSWVRALGSVAIILALAYAVSVSFGGVPAFGFAGGSGNSVEIAEPVGAVREGSLTLDAGVADVTLGSGTDLVAARGYSPWGRPQFTVEKDGDTAEVDLSLDDGNVNVVWPAGGQARLDADFSDEVVWDMVVSTGVSSLEADLSDLSIRSIELKPGVADCDVRLGQVPGELDESRMLLRAGISSVTVRVPEGVDARVESDSGLTAHSVGGDFESLGSGVWETPGFEQARNGGEGVWLITVKSGIGSVVVDTY